MFPRIPPPVRKKAGWKGNGRGGAASGRQLVQEWRAEGCGEGWRVERMEKHRRAAAGEGKEGERTGGGKRGQHFKVHGFPP